MSPKPISEDRGGSSPHATLRHLLLASYACTDDMEVKMQANTLADNPYYWQLHENMVVPSVINGAITALYLTMWGKGLKSCGPVRAILAEYSGAVLGVLSGVLYGRKGHVWKKIPFGDSPDGNEARTEQVIGMKEMLIPIFAGILSALKRVIARRVSLKNQLKRRLNAITIASATCFLFPIAMWDMIIGSTSIELPFSAWAFTSTILFAIILIFYIDSIAEERLQMVFSSPRHLMVAGGCIIVMEFVYKMDFSLPGIHEATSLDLTRKDTSRSSSLSNGFLDDPVEMSPLPT
nr:zinc transporter 5 [Ipomoea trifida]